MRRIAFVEFQDEVGALTTYVQANGLSLDEFTIISFEPKVAAFLHSQSIPYVDTTAFFSNESHKRILDQSEHIMAHLERRFGYVDSLGLKNCYRRELAHYVRVFTNHIMKLLEIVHQVCGNGDDLCLYACVWTDVDGGPLISSSERYLGRIVERVSAVNGFEFHAIGGSSRHFNATEDAPSPILPRIIFRVIQRMLRFRKTILLQHPGEAVKSLMRDLFERDRSIVFLAVTANQSYWRIFFQNVRSAVDLYLKRGPACFHVKPAWGERSGHGVEVALCEVFQTDADEALTYRGVCYTDMVREKMAVAWSHHMSQMEDAAAGLDRFFQSIRSCLILSHVGIGEMAVAAELGRVRGKASVFISHGAHPVPSDPYHELELKHLCRTFMLGDFTHVVLSTPVQEEHLRYFKEKYEGIQNTEILAGPLIFDEIDEHRKASMKEQLGIDAGVTVITHAVTTKSRVGERFHFIETLDELFVSLREVVEVVGGMSEAVLVIRVHPGFPMTEQEIRELLPRDARYIIHDQGPFADILGATDILISYSSTAIDEALLNAIPVVLYDRWQRYDHFPLRDDEAESVLPVCHAKSAEELYDRLVKIQARRSDMKSVDLSRYRYQGVSQDAFYEFVQNQLQHRSMS